MGNQFQGRELVMKEHDQAQEFYDHIAKNYIKINEYIRKYVKKLSKNKNAWDKKNSCWISDFDEWDAFDEHTDVNFWVNTEYSGQDPSEGGVTEMWVTAYLYVQGTGAITETYVNICKLAGKK
jgi:hypothetical protein